MAGFFFAVDQSKAFLKIDRVLKLEESNFGLLTNIFYHRG